jgi:hypothetical protein
MNVLSWELLYHTPFKKSFAGEPLASFGTSGYQAAKLLREIDLTALSTWPRLAPRMRAAHRQHEDPRRYRLH